MATVYGHARYGEQTYGDTSQSQALPPPSSVVDKREQPVLVEPNTAQAPPVTTLFFDQPAPSAPLFWQYQIQSAPIPMTNHSPPP